MVALGNVQARLSGLTLELAAATMQTATPAVYRRAFNGKQIPNQWRREYFIPRGLVHGWHVAAASPIPHRHENTSAPSSNRPPLQLRAQPDSRAEPL
jgi:hypothetical protein